MSRIIQTFTDFGNKKWKDNLEGGDADDMSPDDFSDDDLKIGRSVEREHSSNPDISTEIAMDHLSDDPEYYNKLIASGIEDTEDVVSLFDEIKGDNARDKARKDIMDYFNDNEEDDYDEDEDFEDEDFEEDELGTDKKDFENDELIIDDDEPKNKRQVMEKSVKNYKSFVKEAVDTHPVQPEPAPEEASPERKYSKETKYKFQLPYDKKVVEKLKDYNFIFYTPEGEKEDITKPTKDTHNIIIDILNLTYSIVDNDYPDIRKIDSSRLKHLLDNL